MFMQDNVSINGNLYCFFQLNLKSFFKESKKRLRLHIIIIIKVFIKVILIHCYKYKQDGCGEKRRKVKY